MSEVMMLEGERLVFDASHAVAPLEVHRLLSCSPLMEILAPYLSTADAAERDVRVVELLDDFLAWTEGKCEELPTRESNKSQLSRFEMATIVGRLILNDVPTEDGSPTLQRDRQEAAITFDERQPAIKISRVHRNLERYWNAYRELLTKHLAAQEAKESIEPPPTRRARSESNHVRETLRNGSAGQRLLADSDLFARDIDPGADEYIAREIEQGIVDRLCDPLETWCGVLIGEAGLGKSTLLWQISQRLANVDGYLPILLSASWFETSPGSRRTVDDLIDAIEDLLTAGVSVGATQPVLLLDTVDLLLTDDRSVRAIRSMLVSLEARDIPVLMSSRPWGIEQLGLPDSRNVVLHEYSDEELAAAVSPLASKYCAIDQVNEAVHRVHMAISLALPASDICRSPLLLEMLFQLGGGGIPELTDLDVTGLYRMYWDMRVVRDTRARVSKRSGVDPARDLSLMAGVLGIAFMAAGRIELTRDVLSGAAEKLVLTHRPASQIQVEVAIDSLLDRSILRANADGKLRFFHQTFFEFTAAQGLSRLGSPHVALAIFDELLNDNLDLFLGAVLERLLVASLENPFALPHIKAVVQQLATSPHDAWRRIGLALWARNGALLHNEREVFSTIDEDLLVRISALLPSIAGLALDEALGKLGLIWERSGSLSRGSVLLALERLAKRNPERVGDYLDEKALVSEVMDADSVSGFEYHALSRLLHALSPFYPETARQGLAKIMLRYIQLEHAFDSQSLQDRERQWTATIRAVQRIAQNWSSLASDEFLDELADLLSLSPDFQLAHVFAIGDLYIRQWAEQFDLSAPEGLAQWSAEVLGAIRQGGSEDPAERVRADAILCAVSRMQEVNILADALVEVLLSQLSQEGSGATSDAFIIYTIPQLVNRRDEISDLLISGLRDVLTATDFEMTGTPSLLQDRVAAILSSALFPPDRLRLIIPPKWSENDWWTSPLLTRMLPAAAGAGVSAAELVIAKLSGNTSAYGTADMQLRLLDAAASQAIRFPYVLPVLVELAARIPNVQLLSGRVGLRLYADDWNQRAILAAAKTMFYRSVEGEHDAARMLDVLLMHNGYIELTWGEFDAMLAHTTQPGVLGSLIQCLPFVGSDDDEMPPDEVLEQQFEVLRRYLSVRPSRRIPVTAVESHANDHLGELCARAWLTLTCVWAAPDPRAWATVRSLAYYRVGQAEARPTYAHLELAFHFTTRLFEAGHRDSAREYFLELLGQITPQTPEPEDEHMTRGAVEQCLRSLVGYDTSETIARLSAIVPRTSFNTGLLIVGALGKYPEVARPFLVDLMARVDPMLRGRITDLLREQDRQLGTRAYPELFTLLETQ